MHPLARQEFREDLHVADIDGRDAPDADVVGKRNFQR